MSSTVSNWNASVYQSVPVVYHRPPEQTRITEQSIKVVDLKQYDELWRRKLAEIEGSYQVEEKVVFQEDPTQVANIYTIS